MLARSGEVRWVRGNPRSEATNTGVAFPDSEEALFAGYVDGAAKRARSSARANDANLPLAWIGRYDVTASEHPKKEHLLDPKMAYGRSVRGF